MRYGLLLFLVLIFQCSFSQPSSYQKLKAAIYEARSPGAKLQSLLNFCEQWDCYSPDTLKKYTEELKAIAVSQKDRKAEIIASYYEALWLFQKNKLDTALHLTNQITATYIKNYPYDDIYIKLFGLKANILLRTAQMDELLRHNLMWMKLSEEHRDTLGLIRAEIGMGNVNSRLKKYDSSLTWYHRALDLMTNPVYQQKLSFVYGNICIVFYHLDKEDSALFYIRQGLRYSKQGGNLTDIANAYFLYAGLLAEYQHLGEAEENFKAGLAVRKQIGDVYFLIADMAQVALFYADSKQPEKGIELCKEALALTEKNSIDYNSLSSIYESLAKDYLVASDYKSWGETLTKELSLRDSLYQQNSAEALAEIQTKYDLQKKENTIIQQQFALTKKNYLLWGSAALLLLAIASAILIIQQYQRKQRLKLQLVQQEERRRSEKAVADAEESERKRIAADLHDSLGAYAASIASNIDHLRVSTTEASNLVPLQELRKNSMEIVSQLSDTIWALKKDALSLTMISDRIKIFVQRIQASYPDITMDVFETITTDYLLAPSQAYHLFQIIKEAMNNALKHSQCNYVSVNIEGVRRWKIVVSDNGKGMTTKVTISEGGNGLINMRSRAKESGWKIEWQRNEPKGTQVIIEPTTN